MPASVMEGFSALAAAISAAYSTSRVPQPDLERIMKDLGLAMKTVLGDTAVRPNLHGLLHQGESSERFGGCQNYCTSAYERRFALWYFMSDLTSLNMH